MRIESNIVGVIRQTERLIQRVPEAAARVLRPEHWRDEAVEIATKVLNVLAAPAELKFVPMFISRLAVGLFDGGLSIGMSTPFPALHDILASAQAAAGVTANKDLGMGLFDLPVAEFEELILKWVEASEAEGGKRRDERDAGKTGEEIARLISYIMLTPRPGVKALIARQRLAPHITAFLAAGQADRLPPEKVDLWLRAVLGAWREMVRARFRVKMMGELKAMKGEL
ncbi:MAG TPA: hypothetical protein VH413_16220 [Verrucomicrobiae bacterium]|jgi:hypothetical protein|nr:hypothetical protein [Verrucomicrobiae bacterium]